MNTAPLGRLADNVGDVVLDAVASGKDLVADLASTVHDRAPEVVGHVSSAVRTGADRAPDVGRRLGSDLGGYAAALAAHTPWGRRRQRRTNLRRAAPWLVLVAAVAIVVVAIRRSSSPSPTVATDTHADQIR